MTSLRHQSTTEAHAPVNRQTEFEAFFERHHKELARLAYLLTGDRGESEDLTADTFLATWHRWDTVWSRDHPFAYVRRIMANLAAGRLRRRAVARRRLPLVQPAARIDAVLPDPGRQVDTRLDVRAALQTLPPRRRTCVVLRHAFDLSEAEVAATLGISIGTVKSQTSKGMAHLERLLDAPSSGPISERW